MKKWLIIFTVLFVSNHSLAQDLKNFNLYDPSENAEQKIAALVKQAKAEGKNVFVKIGNNWCIWCARFHQLVTTDASIDSVIRANYLVYHLNYSKENKNEALLAKLGYPQRFGFPVLVVLNAEGKQIHTQATGLLAKGNGYDREKIELFFLNFSPVFDEMKDKE